jgi:hypothetical protein
MKRTTIAALAVGASLGLGALAPAFAADTPAKPAASEQTAPATKVAKHAKKPVKKKAHVEAAKPAPKTDAQTQ